MFVNSINLRREFKIYSQIQKMFTYLKTVSKLKTVHISVALIGRHMTRTKPRAWTRLRAQDGAGCVCQHYTDDVTDAVWPTRCNIKSISSPLMYVVLDLQEKNGTWYRVQARTSILVYFRTKTQNQSIFFELVHAAMHLPSFIQNVNSSNINFCE